MQDLSTININVFIKKLSRVYIKTIAKNATTILNNDRLQRTGFEKRLYLKWKKPLDLLEISINFSIGCAKVKKE